eukprot:scaffold28547_cov57-Phaeocystis_antarctica.AAC.1
MSLAARVALATVSLARAAATSSAASPAAVTASWVAVAAFVAEAAAPAEAVATSPNRVRDLNHAVVGRDHLDHQVLVEALGVHAQLHVRRTRPAVLDRGGQSSLQADAAGRLEVAHGRVLLLGGGHIDRQPPISLLVSTRHISHSGLEGLFALGGLARVTPSRQVRNLHHAVFSCDRLDLILRVEMWGDHAQLHVRRTRPAVLDRANVDAALGLEVAHGRIDLLGGSGFEWLSGGCRVG